jgi:hypothetical protein
MWYMYCPSGGVVSACYSPPHTRGLDCTSISAENANNSTSQNRRLRGAFRRGGGTPFRYKLVKKKKKKKCVKLQVWRLY